jgi:probable addiction module antidote protein
MKPSAPYEEYLVKVLRDPEEGAAFIEAAIEENDDKFLLEALRIVAKAQGGVAKVATRTKLNRVSLYRMLSSGGNPEFRSLLKVIDALGMRLAVLVKRAPKALRPKRVRRGPLATKRPLRAVAPRPKAARAAR